MALERLQKSLESFKQRHKAESVAKQKDAYALADLHNKIEGSKNGIIEFAKQRVGQFASDYKKDPVNAAQGIATLLNSIPKDQIESFTGGSKLKDITKPLEKDPVLKQAVLSLASSADSSFAEWKKTTKIPEPQKPKQDSGPSFAERAKAWLSSKTPAPAAEAPKAAQAAPPKATVTAPPPKPTAPPVDPEIERKKQEAYAKFMGDRKVTQVPRTVMPPQLAATTEKKQAPAPVAAALKPSESGGVILKNYAQAKVVSTGADAKEAAKRAMENLGKPRSVMSSAGAAVVANAGPKEQAPSRANVVGSQFVARQEAPKDVVQRHEARLKQATEAPSVRPKSPGQH